MGLRLRGLFIIPSKNNMVIIDIIVLSMLAVGLWKDDHQDSLVAPDGRTIDPYSQGLFDDHWL